MQSSSESSELLSLLSRQDIPLETVLWEIRERRARLRPLEEQKQEARDSLHSFIRQGWHVLETRPFKDNWHLGAISEHLEAVTWGEIKHLLILVPPGTMKSLSTSVFWLPWMWGPLDQPHVQAMYTSYAQALSNRDSIKCRRILRSEWFQERWGSQFHMEPDRDTITQFANNRNGSRLATSVGGVATGERGDIIVVDDPHNVIQAESDAKRNSVLLWWDEAMTTRTNDPIHSATVVIMQRVHKNDLAGHLLDKGEHTVLQLPMEYEPDHKCFTELRPKSFEGPEQDKYAWDPRTKENELLWSERFPKSAVDKLKRDLGSYAAAAQLQMRPSPRGGGIIKMHWFQRYGTAPSRKAVIRYVQSWDTAEAEPNNKKKGQETAYSVCETWAVTKRGYFLVHVYRERIGIPDLERAIESMYKKWKPSPILIEQKSSGVAMIQYAKRKQLPVIGMLPEADKVTRMDVETPKIEAGNVWLPETADWLPEFESEVRDFPATRHKDQVDSMSQFLKWMREKGENEFDWNMY